MNLFEKTLKLNGFPIAEAKSKLGKIQHISDENFGKYIFETRNEIVAYHIGNNPFYKKIIGNSDVSIWENIPVMTKSNLQCPLEERISKHFKKGSVYINKTSGSSGTPFIFAKDKFCHALTWAEIIDRFGTLGIDFNSSLQARFYGIPLDFKGYYTERIKDFFSHRYRFPVFDLSEKKLEAILNAFKRKKFDFINGYTSSIVFFAKFLSEKNLVLNEICPTLKYCIVTSEMLFEDDKKLMEEVFGVPVINEYGASELDLIAFTNNQNEFVVNSETLFVEILDENDSTVPLGSSGRIVITSLYNKAHPMIRYDIGDIGILSAASTYKKPILEKLIGRTNDMAKLPSGKTVPGLTFYYVTKSVISKDGNVKEFVIEQTELDTFKIKYVSRKELSEREKQQIEKSLFEYLEKDLTIIFDRTAVLKRSKSGKLSQFVSLLNT
ncbi:MAG: phenylacetate--CoA ligase family protein [Flavobacteriaceae bacterium]|nr:phenylacetate--CoA ligase family protein [Flavobacteriaceae bacterium]